MGSFASRVLWSALKAASQVASAPLALPFKPDELYRVPTDDGSAVALARYLPHEKRRFGEPVVLCHGLGANRYSFDFDERLSLARHLARRGFEAWVLELRGRGLAGPPCDATFDQQAEYDVAAAIRAVLSTGARAVSWVGHSKGGLALYAHLSRNPTAPVRAAVALGSPVRFGEHRGLERFLSTVGPALTLPVIPLGAVARSCALLGLPPAPVGPYLACAENMEPGVIRKAVANVSADVAGGVARQLARWVRHDRFDGNDGFDYRAGMKALKLPLLVVAGAKDLLAPPLSVFAAREQVQGPVEAVLAGREGGLEADYGHGDLLLGRRAPEELYVRVGDFLERHSSPAERR